jgi:hypothetical protein
LACDQDSEHAKRACDRILSKRARICAVDCVPQWRHPQLSCDPQAQFRLMVANGASFIDHHHLSCLINGYIMKSLPDKTMKMLRLAKASKCFHLISLHVCPSGKRAVIFAHF